MIPSLISLPGTEYTSSRHYGIFLRGEAPLTSRLLAPMLVERDRVVNTLAVPLVELWRIDQLADMTARTAAQCRAA